MWPSTLRLLQEAGLRAGMTFLDVGCGTGAVSVRVADLGVDVLGIDADAGFIEAARGRDTPARFKHLNALDIATLGQFDFVYARYLLSHLPDPMAVLREMVRATRPGGRVVLEDIDFDLHVAEPCPPAFARYLELYRDVVRLRGGDPILGRKLFAMAVDAELRQVHPRIQLTLARDESQPLTSLTLRGIRTAVLAHTLATETELDRLIEEIEALESDPKSLISVAGTHQVWGIKES
jgi:SAM-dependent methyltransferase